MWPLIQSQAALDSAHSDVVAAASTIDVAKADAGTVVAHLAYTKIEAPFDGIVTQRNVNTGDLTQPGADKPPLFIVARSDIMTIRVNVPEAFAAEVNPGDRATVRLQEMKGKTVEGKVTRVSWALDPKMRTLRVEIDIPNPGAKLQPGLYAYATVIAEEHPEVLTLPVTAVVSEQGKDYCVAIVAGKAAAPPDPGRAQRRHPDRGRLGPGRARSRGEGQRRLARGRTARGSRRSGQSFAIERETLTVTRIIWVDFPRRLAPSEQPVMSGCDIDR